MKSTMERMDNHSAINLIFAAGFSTAAVVTDLSGRGVGMDVVRTTVQKLNGTGHGGQRNGQGYFDPHFAAALDGRYSSHGDRIRWPALRCAYGSCH